LRERPYRPPPEKSAAGGGGSGLGHISSSPCLSLMSGHTP
jgi:hypothetical protein